MYEQQTLRDEEEVGTRELKVASVDEAASFRVTKLLLAGHAVLINDDLLHEGIEARLVSVLCPRVM